jgi:hypothetical protein
MSDMDHDHDTGTCPLCPPPAYFAEMRERNRVTAAEKRTRLLAEIDADPAAFVHVVEGYEDDNDRSSVIMLVASTVEKARAYCTAVRSSGIFEITPNRIDDERTGEVVLWHYIVDAEGQRVEREGRFYREDA